MLGWTRVEQLQKSFFVFRKQNFFVELAILFSLAVIWSIGVALFMDHITFQYFRLELPQKKSCTEQQLALRGWEMLVIDKVSVGLVIIPPSSFSLVPQTF